MSDDEKNRHAQALSKLGASKGGFARAAKMTPAQRAESGRRAAEARWAKLRELGVVPQRPQRPRPKKKPTTPHGNW
jgi:hypothetical protein